jgi:hypothetical protein
MRGRKKSSGFSDWPFPLPQTNFRRRHGHAEAENKWICGSDFYYRDHWNLRSDQQIDSQVFGVAFELLETQSVYIAIFDAKNRDIASKKG